MQLSFKQYSRCGATYDGHPVISYRSHLFLCVFSRKISYMFACPSPNEVSLSFTRDPSPKSIMIWHMIEQLLQKGITWIAKRYVWGKVRKISVPMYV